jgi:hypothetical protein
MRSVHNVARTTAVAAALAAGAIGVIATGTADAAERPMPATSCDATLTLLRSAQHRLSFLHAALRRASDPAVKAAMSTELEAVRGSVPALRNQARRCP